MTKQRWTWRRVRPEQVASLQRDPVDSETLAKAATIVEAVRRDGESALREYAEQFGDLEPGQPLVIERPELEAALSRISREDKSVLERTAERIAGFARAQRDALSPTETTVDGGVAGHDIAPVDRAGCYAPGGRYPLPSSVLMTAVTARAAGVPEIWVASPRPTDLTLAAAAVADARGVLSTGGAHAIAALAFGSGPLRSCDVIVGPGNRWVTAAKQLVSWKVGIDMLAGPSELVTLADATADPEIIAADLLAQAEHDPDALPILVTPESALANDVKAAIARRLADLPTAEIASQALANGYSVVTRDLDEAISVCDTLAPEHLQVMCENATSVAERCRHWGGLFIGTGSAEVLGDYGAGPNHTLPTGGVARFKGGLSVFDFLRVRTYLRIYDSSDSQELVRDAVRLARMEGLEGHARAAEMRLRD